MNQHYYGANYTVVCARRHRNGCRLSSCEQTAGLLHKAVVKKNNGFLGDWS